MRSGFPSHEHPPADSSSDSSDIVVSFPFIDDLKMLKRWLTHLAYYQSLNIQHNTVLVTVGIVIEYIDADMLC